MPATILVTRHLTLSLEMTSAFDFFTIPSTPHEHAVSYVRVKMNLQVLAINLYVGLGRDNKVDPLDRWTGRGVLPGAHELFHDFDTWKVKDDLGFESILQSQ